MTKTNTNPKPSENLKKEIVNVMDIAEHYKGQEFSLEEIKKLLSEENWSCSLQELIDAVNSLIDNGIMSVVIYPYDQDNSSYAFRLIRP